MLVNEKMARSAWDVLRSAYTGEEDFSTAFPPSRDALKTVHKRAAMATHPDRGGDAATFVQVDRAKCIMEEWLKAPRPATATQKKRDCDYCAGAGHVHTPSRTPGSHGLRRTCPKCRGSGDADYDPT